MKQILKQGNYKYITYLGNKEHLLLNLNTKEFEIWFANKNHASYGLIYKNTHLEFAHGLNDLEKTILSNTIRKYSQLYL